MQYCNCILRRSPNCKGKSILIWCNLASAKHKDLYPIAGAGQAPEWTLWTSAQEYLDNRHFTCGYQIFKCLLRIFGHNFTLVNQIFKGYRRIDMLDKYLCLRIFVEVFAHCLNIQHQVNWTLSLYCPLSPSDKMDGQLECIQKIRQHVEIFKNFHWPNIHLQVNRPPSPYILVYWLMCTWGGAGRLQAITVMTIHTAA